MRIATRCAHVSSGFTKPANVQSTWYLCRPSTTKLRWVLHLALENSGVEGPHVLPRAHEHSQVDAMDLAMADKNAISQLVSPGLLLMCFHQKYYE